MSKRRDDPLEKKGFTGVVGPGAMATYRVIPRPRAKFNAVWFAAANAAWQMSAISGHMPETLTSVALQYAVRRLRYIFLIRLWNIISIVRVS